MTMGISRFELAGHAPATRSYTAALNDWRQNATEGTVSNRIIGLQTVQEIDSAMHAYGSSDHFSKRVLSVSALYSSQ